MNHLKHGRYVVMPEGTIDNAWWREDHVFESAELAIKKAKKFAFKTRDDFYIAELINVITLNPDVEIETLNLLEKPDESVQP